MYAVDERDRVQPFTEIPTPDVGAPTPVIVSDEGTVALAFYTDESSVALVRFHGFAAYLFGEPNDEAFSGHPLASRGLEPYGCFVITDSSWLRALEAQNSVHERHDPARYAKLTHFVIAFHDSTFECVGEKPEVSLHRGEVEHLWPQLQASLSERVV
jgi:hypothetical protein